MITALRAETEPLSISPEALGVILQALADALSTASTSDFDVQDRLDDLQAQITANADDIAANAASSESSLSALASRVSTLEAQMAHIIKQEGFISAVAAGERTAEAFNIQTVFKYLEDGSSHAPVTNLEAVVIPAATSTQAGLLTAELYGKLSGLSVYQVLDTMGYDLDNVGLAEGEDPVVFVTTGAYTGYDPDTDTIVTVSASGAKTSATPSGQVIYCNKFTNRIYRYNAASQTMVEMGSKAAA